MIFNGIVSEVLDFDDYWSDERFLLKKPVMNGSLACVYGDNIYHRKADGEFQQTWSFHSHPDGSVHQDNLNQDTGTTTRMLVFKQFNYFGVNAVDMPAGLECFIHRGIGRTWTFPEDKISELQDWIMELGWHGFQGRPTLWPNAA